MSHNDPYDPNAGQPAPYGQQQPPQGQYGAQWGQQQGQDPYGQYGAPQGAYAQYPQQGYGGAPQDPYGQQGQYGAQYGDQYAAYGQQGQYAQYPQQGYGNPYQPLTAYQNYAGWGSRVGGYLIDGLITIPGAIIYGIGFGIGMSGVESHYDFQTQTTVTTGSFSPVGLILILIGLALMIGIQIWNRWIRGGKTGQTIGRKTVGITMVSEQTGQPIGPGMAFVRDIAHCVDSIIMCLGWLWPLWDDKHQTLADKIVGTVVIESPK